MNFGRPHAWYVSLMLPLALAAPAFAQQNPHAATALPPAAPPNAASAPVPGSNTVTPLPHEGTTTMSPADEAFVQKAAQGGIAEVQLAQLAQQKTQSDSVKNFAQTMIDDHTPNNQKLVKLANSKGVTPPTEPNAMQQKMASRLEALSGQKFDSAYIKGQIRAHETMLKLFQAEAVTGQDPDLKAFAAQTTPVIEHHLSLAEQLRKAGA